MKKGLAIVLALALCLTALTAVAETKVSFFTGKIETIDLLNGIIDAFNAANPGIVVEQEYQKDASSIIKVKFASGEVPDVMTTWAGWLGQFTAAGWVKPLTDYITGTEGEYADTVTKLVWKGEKELYGSY